MHQRRGGEHAVVVMRVCDRAGRPAHDPQVVAPFARDAERAALAVGKEPVAQRAGASLAEQRGASLESGEVPVDRGGCLRGLHAIRVSNRHAAVNCAKPSGAAPAIFDGPANVPGARAGACAWRDFRCRRLASRLENLRVVVSLPTVRSPIQLKLAENPPVEGRVRVLAPGATRFTS